MVIILNNLFSYLILSLLAFFISIIFISCSSELNITSPSTSNINNKANDTINVSKELTSSDTLIYLPLSGKTFRIKKGLKSN
jgi:hypothetical protein